MKEVRECTYHKMKHYNLLNWFHFFSSFFKGTKSESIELFQSTSRSEVIRFQYLQNVRLTRKMKAIHNYLEKVPVKVSSNTDEKVPVKVSSTDEDSVKK